jgi:hypothetical protein
MLADLIYESTKYKKCISVFSESNVYPRQYLANVNSDSLWQMSILDSVWQMSIPDSVWQISIPDSVWQMSITDSVWQMSILDSVWQMSITDGVWQMSGPPCPNLAPAQHDHQYKCPG